MGEGWNSSTERYVNHSIGVIAHKVAKRFSASELVLQPKLTMVVYLLDTRGVYNLSD